MKMKKVIALVFASAVILPAGVLAIMFFDRGTQIKHDQAFVGAASDGDTSQMDTLLDHGENVNASSFDNTSGLWSAAFNRQLSAVRFLLLHGANTETPSQFGQTPLEGAVENLSNDTGTPSANVDVAIIKLLIGKKANITKIKRSAASVSLLKSYGVKI